MNESKLKSVKTFVRVITTAAFILFIAYQTFLFVVIPTQRVGRLLGIFCYAFLAAASLFALIHRHGIRVFRSVFLAVSLLGLFLMRLMNVPLMFTVFDINNLASVLYVGVYVATQAATLLLVIYYLGVRINKKVKNKRTVTVVMMSITIALYFAVLIMEYVLILKYRVSIEYSQKLTLMARVLYFTGFAGTALSFMLPTERAKSTTEQYINKEQSAAEMIVSSPEKSSSRSNKNKKIAATSSDEIVFSPVKNSSNKNRTRVLDDSDIIFTTEKSSSSHSKKHSGKSSSGRYDNEFILTSPQRSSSHSSKDKKRTRVVDDSDIVFSTPKKSSSHSDREKHRSVAVDENDIVFSQSDNIRDYR